MSEHASPEETSPCVHCGLCLEACPTYRLTGVEAESPRGRLYLMNAIDGGRAQLDESAAGHLSSCLGCLACETACPSGVAYGRRIEEFRPRLRATGLVTTRVFRALAYRALRSERHQRIAGRAATLLDSLGLGRVRRRIPGIGLMPKRAATASRAQERLAQAPSAEPRLSVALLTGCGARVLRPSLETAVLDALSFNGIRAHRLDARYCCGALALHEGRTDEAHVLASETLRRARELGVDYVVTAAAGCRAALGDAESHAKRGTLGTEPSQRNPLRVREVCELLVENDFRKPRARSAEVEIAYHDACHLLHAAHVTAPPRAVLESTGAAVVDLGENSVCCGSAGTYNLIHREAANALGRRKAELVVERGVRRLAVANLGCILQIERALARRGIADVRIAHPVEYLAEAYRADLGE